MVVCSIWYKHTSINKPTDQCEHVWSIADGLTLWADHHSIVCKTVLAPQIGCDGISLKNNIMNLLSWKFHLETSTIVMNIQYKIGTPLWLTTINISSKYNTHQQWRTMTDPMLSKQPDYWCKGYLLWWWMRPKAHFSHEIFYLQTVCRLAKIDQW
jgi:hypothetical protein